MRDVDSEMGKQTTTHSESDQSLEIEASLRLVSSVFLVCIFPP